VRVFSLLTEGFEGGAGKVGAREADGGKRRKSEFSKIDIVEANDTEVLRDAQAFHVGGTQNTNGGHVV